MVLRLCFVEFMVAIVKFGDAGLEGEEVSGEGVVSLVVDIDRVEQAQMVCSVWR